MTTWCQEGLVITFDNYPHSGVPHFVLKNSLGIVQRTHLTCLKKQYMWDKSPLTLIYVTYSNCYLYTKWACLNMNPDSDKNNF